MKFRLFGASVRFHPLLSALTAVSLLTGNLLAFLCSVIALTLHEGGHLLAARLFRLRVTSVEITPFGGLIEAEGIDALPGAKRLILAAAGVAVNALLAFLSVRAYARGLLAFDWSRELLRANLALLLINLLPVLPLDGGRMAEAILRKFFDEKAVARVLTALGTLCGLAFILVSVALACRGELLFSPAFSGLYLMYMASAARKSAASRYVSSLIGRRQKLAQGGALAVQWLAASEKTPARELLGRLALHQYHMLTVVREDGARSLGALDEEALCEGLLSDPSATLGTLLRRQKGQA